MELLWKELGTIRCVGNLLWEKVLPFVLITRCWQKVSTSLSLGRQFGSLRPPLELFFLCGLQIWGIFWLLIILGNGRFWFWIGVVCVKEMGNQLTTSSSTALLLLMYGQWCLLCLAFIGLCQKQWWNCWLTGKESLGDIGILLFGWLCLIVWCGAFGGRGITGILRI